MPAIQPTNPLPTPQLVPQSGTPDTTKKAEPAKAAKVTAPAKTQSKPSPIKEQARDVRGQPDYSPVQIVILNGAHKGKAVDLGIAVNEIQHSETAEWESQDGDGIRVGVNFKRLSPREISLSLTYYSAIEDVSHLAENLKHLKEITEGEARPPLLLFTQGSMQASECVCTSIRDKYSEPHPGRRGLRRADIEIALLLSGGKNSSYSAGSPLTSTPLGDERAKQTEAERQKRGQQAVVEKLLVPCLGENGSASLSKLLENDQFKDVAALSKLESATFIQAAIAGMVPGDLLGSDLLPKLRQDLAIALAANEDGVRQADVRNFANALLSGDGAGLAPYLQEQLPKTKNDFELIFKALGNQDLGEDSSVFDSRTSGTAGERLRRMGSCGLDLRRSGAAQLAASPPNKKDVETLKDINEFFASQPSDNEIRDRFGIYDPAFNIRALKNAFPYQSLDEFVERAAKSNKLIDGEFFLSNFQRINKERKTLAAINEFFSKKPSVEEMRARFGIEQGELNTEALLSGAPYKSPEDFFSVSAGSFNGSALWSRFQSIGNK